ncbi:MAG: PA2169 family four-helix-bundle protein [Leeuwenhoekiella sp.]
METTSKEISSEIKDILEKNEDASRGYKKASENAKSLELKAYFKDKSANRTRYNREIQQAAATHFPELKENASFSGTVHRAWMDVKALFSADDDESMLEESIRGDKAAIKEYNDVINVTTLPVSLRDILIKQRESIQMDLSKNKRLEDLS